MNWKFTILNNRTGDLNEIEEPVGWDKTNAEIRRDTDWHGIFFDDAGDSLEFIRDAEILIREEYEVYGANGDMTLIIEEDCGQGWVEFYRGKFDFLQYDHICADYCFVKCPVESSSDVMEFRNRKDQKADLGAAKTFDGIVNLSPYTNLPFDMELPSKGIFIQDRANTEEQDSVEEFDGGLQAVLSGPEANITLEQIEFGLPDNQLSEIGSFSVNATHTMDLTSQNSGSVVIPHFPPGVFPGNGWWPMNLSPIQNFLPGSVNYDDIQNPVYFNVQLVGKLETFECYLGTVGIYLLRLPDRPGYTTNGEHEADYEILKEDCFVSSGSGSFPSGYQAPPYTHNFGFGFSGDVVLSKNDRFYLFMALTERKTQDQIDAVNAGTKAMKLTLDKGNSWIKITNLSHTRPTISKAYAINETISRITEIITNDKLRAYSEYFGRTDSQPYAVNEDGCGSLEVVTDGLRIRRQENKFPGKTTPFTLSINDIFNGLNPIHNIGMGIEPDPMRPGKNRLRVEPWHYFYDDKVIMSCIGVNKIERKVFEKEIFSTFRFGYNKWEAEEYNGLDEFLTKRIYRTTLGQVSNELTKLSTMIASGYALEVTRRKGNADTKDWRYDKETFLICCTRIRKFHVIFDPTLGTKGGFYFDYAGDPALFSSLTSIDVLGSVSNDGTFNVQEWITGAGMITMLWDGTGGPGSITAEISYDVTFPGIDFGSHNLFVELGNVEISSNIIDPNTIYNFRISPIRNAMRWMTKVLETYRSFDADAKIIFTDGDGNIFAQGKMESAVCRNEAGVIAENAEISISVFADIEKARPFLRPERVSFEYPLSAGNFRDLKMAPRGLIHFENDCDSGEGWIDLITYSPESGLAKFNLIPKI